MFFCHQRRYQSVSERSLEHEEDDLKRRLAAQSSAYRETADCSHRDRSLRILGDPFAQFLGEIDFLPCHDRYRRVRLLRIRAAT